MLSLCSGSSGRRREARGRLQACLAFTLIGVLLDAPEAWALDPNRAITQYVRDMWLRNDGLPDGEINAIAQTADGYLWLGTRRGLVRFDGNRFRVFTSADTPAMSSSNVWGLAPAADGGLWFTTFGGVVHRSGDGHLAVYDAKQGLHVPNTMTVAETPGGCVWVGLGQGGITCLKDGRFTQRPIQPQPVMVRAFAQSASGVLWAATPQGIIRVQGETSRYYGQPQGLASVDTSAICVDRHGTVWAGTRAGLAKLEGERFRMFTVADGLSDDRVRAVLADRDDNLWIGTQNGLNRLTRGRIGALSREGGLSDNIVLALAEDREGSIWVGTSAGLNRLRAGVFTPVGRPEGLPNEDVRVVCAGKSGLYTITNEQGLLEVLPNGGVRVVVARESFPFQVGSVLEGPDGSLWIGGPGVVYRLRDGKIERVPIAEGSITPQFVDAGGPVVIQARPDGLRQVWRVSQGTPVPLLPSPLRGVSRVRADAKGVLWLNTADGILRKAASGDRLFGPADGLSDPVITGLDVDPEGDVWIGMRSSLVRIRGERVFAFSARHGVPAEAPSHMRSDGLGHLWVAWDGGIFRVPITELDEVAGGREKAVTVSPYGTADGLRSITVSWVTGGSSRGPDGRLWFATSRGLVSVDPAAVKRNEVPPRVYVEDLVGDGTPVVGGRIPAGTDRIEIRYTGLSFLAPHQVQFQYRLDGHDRDWVDGGTRRVAYYNGLRPRKYVFHVKAANADGVWSQGEAALAFELLPTWYQTWVFYGLCLLAMGAGAYGIYFWRMSQVRDRARELARRVEERTADLHKEVQEHERTERKLQEEAAERRRAEEEAHANADKLARSNADLRDNQAALERENQERRRAEEEAGRERDLLHALMQNSPDLIYFKDANSSYTRINAAHAEALGLAGPEQAIGRSDADFHPAELARGVRDEERALMTAGRALAGEVEHDARRDRYYLTTKVPLRDASGRVSGLVGISRDITARKKAEEKLEQDLGTFLGIVKEVAQGDLTRRGAEGDDTLGRIAHSMNEMLDGFSEILAEMRDAAFSVSSSATEILTAATEIAKGAQFGSDEVHTTSSAIEQMAVSMARVSQNADHSAEAASQVLEHVRTSEHSVSATTHSMGTIDAAVGATAEKMALLQERSRKVFEIIELIDEISSQSNLLSLNAAIEAAHAGEAGRVFGVVADEIRRLADSSKQATEEANQIVEGIVEETRAVLAAMENAMAQVKEGRSLAEQAQRSLQEIQMLVQQSAQLSGLISTASREQTLATETVAQSMQAITSLTHQSAAGAKEATTTVRYLVQLSEHLTEAVSRFRIEEGAGARPSQPGASDRVS